mmetsp:Transcript_14783/g.34169  ORF Transcript_14783/g.34169 Transcript_14783/m.34169 type:complete len:156 (+) Transcript_14783:193-660(+)
MRFSNNLLQPPHYVLSCQEMMHRDAAIERRKGDFRLFLRVLIKYLERRDLEMYVRARAILREFAENNRNKVAGYESLMVSTQSRLRPVVGEEYWKRALAYHDHFQKKKRDKTASKRRQQQGQPSGSVASSQQTQLTNAMQQLQVPSQQPQQASLP